jgi:hypothetical protein
MLFPSARAALRVMGSYTTTKLHPLEIQDDHNENTALSVAGRVRCDGWRNNVGLR